MNFALSVLLLPATACFAQSSAGQPIKIPYGTSGTLHANSVNAASYQWMKNGNIIPGATQLNYVVTTSGVYTVQAFNVHGCPSETSDPTTVIVEPNAVLSADVMIAKSAESRSVSLNDPFEYLLKIKNNGAGTATQVRVKDVLPDELVFESLVSPAVGTANYSQVTRTVSWNIDQMYNGQTAELRLMVKAIKPGIVKNTATVSSFETDPVLTNNSAADSKMIAGIIIANTFTPNGDGKNDTFVIPGIENYADNNLVILNRFGSHVYESKNYKNDWTGEGLNEGTYFYILKLKNAAGGLDVYKGYITLLRTKTN
ncbi:gliding motility-associated C-terminal domain-containing protein [Pedobacter sp. MC2016-14]|uniref:T9SS type B sorting domain-containing protein n=1 Tax=Pedobacter sp. MC2016-14 TaxID=2897327 RepID=UPI001E3329EA|nr:gliding motility-associated C-terminal domain-containing protein [Pedobacter sp. MC2016-14]MCD0490629.1 gliding motility-associated C-terminal domain-containing protein [Pedobacter sp. MC2016-14]